MGRFAIKEMNRLGIMMIFPHPSRESITRPGTKPRAGYRVSFLGASADRPPCNLDDEMLLAQREMVVIQTVALAPMSANCVGRTGRPVAISADAPPATISDLWIYDYG